MVCTNSPRATLSLISTVEAMEFVTTFPYNVSILVSIYTMWLSRTWPIVVGMFIWILFAIPKLIHISCTSILWNEDSFSERHMIWTLTNFSKCVCVHLYGMIPVCTGLFQHNETYWSMHHHQTLTMHLYVTRGSKTLRILSQYP